MTIILAEMFESSVDFLSTHESRDFKLRVLAKQSGLFFLIPELKGNLTSINKASKRKHPFKGKLVQSAS